MCNAKILLKFILLSVVFICSSPIFSWAQNENSDEYFQHLSTLNNSGDYTAMIPIATQLINDDNSSTQASGYYWRGLALAQLDEFEGALKSYYSAIDLYSSIQDSGNVALLYGEIAVVYYDIEDLKRAEQYTLKSIDLLRALEKGEFTGQIAGKYFNLGNFYLSAYSKGYDPAEAEKSMYYYQLAQELYETNSDFIDSRYMLELIDANRVTLYALSQNPAFNQLFDHSVNAFRQRKDSLQLSLLFSAKSQYISKKSAFSEALIWSDSALSYFPDNGQAGFLVDFYNIRSEILNSLNQASEALHFKILADSIEEALRNPQIIGDLQVISSNAERRKLEELSSNTIESITTGHQRKKRMLYWVIGGVLLLLCISGFILFRYSKHRHTLLSKLSIAKEDNRRFKEELKKYRETKTTSLDKSSYAYLLEEISLMLTKDNSFTHLIGPSKKIGFPFILELKQNYPKLSRNELRLCVFLLIGMSSKDLSRILHIEPASVDRQRYRLRKKMGLNAQENLTLFLEGLERSALENYDDDQLDKALN